LIVVPSFQTIPAKAWHCGQIARLISSKNRDAMRAAGFDPHKEFSGAFDNTVDPKAWLIDGKLAALGGVAGSALSPYGFLWLALAESAARYPLAIIKEARRQIAEALATRREIVTTIIPGNYRAIRFAEFLGFEFRAWCCLAGFWS